MSSRRYTKPTKKLTKLTVPQQAVPHVKFLYAEMHRQRLTYEDVEWKSGVLKNTLKAWRHKNQPNLANIEACLGAIGWSLVPVPAESSLPADIVAELRPIADRLGLTMPTTVELLIEILARGSRFPRLPTIPRCAVLPDIAFFQSSQWAIDEGAFRALMSVVPQALSAYTGKPLMGALKASVRDGVAVLPVEGPLFRKPNFITDILGASTYQTIRQDLQTALDDPNVKAILLNINSPGGEVQGTSELAQAIRDARGTKPIVAYAGDLAASAAYWIASAADKIVIGKSAVLGSIGVIAGYTDTSARDARSGVQAIKIISSQSPFKQADPTTEAGLVRIQARVDAVADVFIDAVAANRGVPRDQVLSDFGQGDVLIGKAAVAAGMADEIGSFESVLAKLTVGEPVSRRPVVAATRTMPVITSTPQSAPVASHTAAEQAHAMGMLKYAKDFPALTKQAIAEGWPVDRLRAAVEPELAARFIMDSARLARRGETIEPVGSGGEQDATSFIMAQYRRR